MNTEEEQATEAIVEAADEEPKAKQPWYKQKRIIGIAAACAVVLIAGGAGAVAALNQQAPAAVENVASSSGNSSSSSSDSGKAQNKETGQKSEETSNDASRPADSTTPNTSGQAEGGEASDTANSTNTSNETNAPAVAQASGSEGQKTWVADYQQQWVPNVVTVVDQAAYDEQIPIYEQQRVTRCSYCGADISNNASEHLYEHTVQGIFCSGRTTSEQVLVGYDTISHPAVTHTEDQGHYETVAAGGHWE